MNVPSLTTAIADAWPIIIGCFIGSMLGHCFPRRPLVAAQIRKQLGRRVDAYSTVPQQQFDEALVAAASESRKGFQVLRPIFGNTLLIVLALFSAQVYGDCFPHLPRWHTYCVAGLVAGFMVWPMQWLERRAITRQLRQHLPIHA